MSTHGVFGACVTIIALLAACTPKPMPHERAEAVPRTDIVALGLQRTSCYGTCPAYSVQFSSGDRAMYMGGLYAVRQGRYTGRVRFDRLAAWVDSQRPGTLAASYATSVIDAPFVTLTIERRGKPRQTVIVGDEEGAPLRFQGITLALDGAAAHVHWVRSEAYAVPFGTYVRNRTRFVVAPGDDGRVAVFVNMGPRWCRGPLRVLDRGGGLRLECGRSASDIRPGGDGLMVTGSLLEPGVYVRAADPQPSATGPTPGPLDAVP